MVKNTLAAIFVLPEKQGQGVGKQLITDAKSRCNTLALSVYQRNVASVAFYQQQGFEIIAQDEDPLAGQAQYIMSWQDRQTA
ncbi:GNAT family N-acetyltransferase [Pseudoalteromonas luteoviolacea]|uniref:GNAT family N-acetyltransferase n=1 Tax=Pseudoalteromonas luteoviolacea TaxID=43657 RepID=UPI00068B87C9|nr:GNAT family N-acetyltransferase [Pseudoalteromonas luteoviolacea]